MEDYTYSATERDKYNGKEKKVVFWVPRFTLIGATTRPGNLDLAFVERFKLRFTLNLYNNAEISLIIRKYCISKKLNITEDAIVEIVNRSRGVPRKCINFVERCVDTSIYLKVAIINKTVVDKTFEILSIDPNGLEELDIKVLEYLYKVYPQKIGIARLASIINVTENALKEIVEPYLLRQGYIEATPGGRMISNDGMEYLERYNIVKKPIGTELLGGKV
jgi:Holliday junction DNA helicase RuvB